MVPIFFISKNIVNMLVQRSTVLLEPRDVRETGTSLLNSRLQIEVLRKEQNAYKCSPCLGRCRTSRREFSELSIYNLAVQVNVLSLASS
jgi:hypothetical protein